MKTGDFLKKLAKVGAELEKKTENTCMTVVPLVGGPLHGAAYCHLGPQDIPNRCPHGEEYRIDSIEFTTTQGRRVVVYYRYMPDMGIGNQMAVMDALLIFHGDEVVPVKDPEGKGME